MRTADFEKHLFRCSALGKLMVNPRYKKDTLSVTTKRYLQELHKEVLFDKSTEIQSRYLDKGIEVEDDSIAMYSRVTGENVMKNDKFYMNDFICGTPDIVGNKLIDIKSSWDYTTFPMYEESLPSKDYYWQLQGYMTLTGKKESWVVYCLVDTPDSLIDDEIRRTGWKLGMIEVPLEMETEIISNHKYSHVPEELRIKKFKVEYNAEDVERLYERIDVCRDYLTDLSVGLSERIIKPII